MSSNRRHNYKNLKIWQLEIEIANDISDILIDFPIHERYDLISQISRCSVSIPSNIEEGSSRTDKSFSPFLDISLGSSFELITQLIVAKHRKYNRNNISKFRNKNRRISKNDHVISKWTEVSLFSILYFL